METQTVGYKVKAFEPRNLVYYFLIVFGLQALRYGLLISGVLKMPSGEGPASFFKDPSIIIITIASWGPLIAAFLVTALTEGKTGVRTLWGRFWNKNMSFKWLFVTLLFLPAIALVDNLVIRLLDGENYPVFFPYHPAWTIVTSFAYAFFANGVLEEFGWRGYVLPRFQARWNALASSLILSVLWIAWHAGQWFVPGSNLYGRDFWLWSLGMILLTIIMTWIFNNTKGSVLAAALFHATINTGVFALLLDWRYYVLELLVVILIVVIFGPNNLVRRKPEPVGILSEAKAL
jgi:membrane protease YdiL (CAAX protease family)